ncbi:hypothetical protein ACFQRB_20210 [Halobaculum litoreum]|uniref:ATP-grasp domain-containing protein n=1 Tax=Halobaculum litoreum TaxID=3031998 RepID=A0ABD5XRL4_9EURY
MKDDATGEYKLLEINPRFWASLPSDIHAGADIPYHYWLHATGRTDEIDPSFEPGVMSHRLRGLVSHVYSVAFEEYPWSRSRRSRGRCGKSRGTSTDTRTSIS